MKAAVLREVDRPLEVEEVQVDSPGPREVLIRTRASGICHSDLHFVEGKYSIPCRLYWGMKPPARWRRWGNKLLT